VSHASGYIHLLYPDATIDPAVYSRFADKLNSFLDPPEGAADRRGVAPRLPDPSRVRFSHADEPLGITPEMEYAEVAQRLHALRDANRSAALAPYAGHELGDTECGPFIRAALNRSPVSKCATLEQIAALGGESIYDGTSRLAQPDEAWNFGTADGLEKCLLAANAVGGTEIRIDADSATLLDGEAEVCSFPTVKRPRDCVWPLRDR